MDKYKCDELEELDKGGWSDLNLEESKTLTGLGNARNDEDAADRNKWWANGLVDRFCCTSIRYILMAF